MKNLVISSGGVYIFSLLGSLKYLKENNMLEDTKSYYGISAGSILCTMLALDYTIEEITDFLINFNFLKLLDSYDITNLINDYGISLGENLKIITQSIIIFKLGEENKDYTFKQLYDDKKIELNIFATCIDDKSLWKFSYNSNENIPIWKAIIASSNIPFIFAPIEIENKLFVDGAIINCFPINYVSYDELDETIGLYIDYYYNLNIDYLNDIPNLKYYLEIILLYVTHKFNYSYKNTINISLPDKYKKYTYKFDICNEEKNILIDIGYNFTKNYYKILANKKVVKKIKRSNSCGF